VVEEEAVVIRPGAVTEGARLKEIAVALYASSTQGTLTYPERKGFAVPVSSS
jgi:hypothetical protein